MDELKTQKNILRFSDRYWLFLPPGLDIFIAIYLIVFLFFSKSNQQYLAFRIVERFQFIFSGHISPGWTFSFLSMLCQLEVTSNVSFNLFLFHSVSYCKCLYVYNYLWFYVQLGLTIYNTYISKQSETFQSTYAWVFLLIVLFFLSTSKKTNKPK